MLARSIVAALAVLSCVFTAASAQDLHGKRVALLTNALTSGWVAGYNATAIKLLSAHGIKVVNMVSPGDAALQSQQLDDAIAQKFDAIILHHINEVAVVPALERVKKAGIPVVLSIDDIAAGHSDLYVTLVGVDIPSNARDAADALAAKMNGKPGKVAIVQAIPVQNLVKTLVSTFQKELAVKAPNLKVVAVEGKSWSPAEAGTVTRELMLRFAPQGGLQGILAMNDFMAAQVISALQAGSTSPGKDVFVVSTACAKVGLDAVRAGTLLATVDNGPINQAKVSTDVVMKVLQGDRNFPKFIAVPTAVINKADVDQHTEDCTF